MLTDEFPILLLAILMPLAFFYGGRTKIHFIGNTHVGLPKIDYELMKNEKKIPIYILCGGKSSRMQTEKGLVLFEGKTFVQRILEAVRLISNTIFLITKNREYTRFGHPLIADILIDKGPLGGIYTALSHSTADLNMVLSCDIPLISTGILENLVLEARHNDAEICFLADSRNDCPLIAVYSKKVLPAMQLALHNNELSLQSFIKKQNHKRIVVKKEHENFLQNINTKKELESLAQY